MSKYQFKTYDISVLALDKWTNIWNTETIKTCLTTIALLIFMHMYSKSGKEYANTKTVIMLKIWVRCDCSLLILLPKLSIVSILIRQIYITTKETGVQMYHLKEDC